MMCWRRDVKGRREKGFTQQKRGREAERKNEGCLRDVKGRRDGRRKKLKRRNERKS